MKNRFRRMTGTSGEFHEDFAEGDAARLSATQFSGKSCVEAGCIQYDGRRDSITFRVILRSNVLANHVSLDKAERVAAAFRRVSHGAGAAFGVRQYVRTPACSG